MLQLYGSYEYNITEEEIEEINYLIMKNYKQFKG
jgi:hypothetical protein